MRVLAGCLSVCLLCAASMCVCTCSSSRERENEDEESEGVRESEGEGEGDGEGAGAALGFLDFEWTCDARLFCVIVFERERRALRPRAGGRTATGRPILARDANNASFDGSAASACTSQLNFAAC